MREADSAGTSGAGPGYRAARPASARSPKRFEPGSVPLPKPGYGQAWGAGNRGPASAGGFTAAYAHLAPSRWKDSVKSEAELQVGTG